MKHSRVIKGAVIVWSAGLMMLVILVKTGGLDDALSPVTHVLLGSPNGSPLLTARTDTSRSDTTLISAKQSGKATVDTSWMTSPTAPIPATAYPNWREFLEREAFMMMASSKSMTISPRRINEDSNAAKQRMRQAHIDSLKRNAR